MFYLQNDSVPILTILLAVIRKRAKTMKIYLSNFLLLCTGSLDIIPRDILKYDDASSNCLIADASHDIILANL